MATDTSSARYGLRKRGQAHGQHAARGDSRQEHAKWLGLVAIDGPFLSMPTLLRVWPQLDSLDGSARRRLRLAHIDWHADPQAQHRQWISYILRDLVGWRDALQEDDALRSRYSLDVPVQQETITPSFLLVHPDAPESDSAVLLGLVCDPGAVPTARQPGAAWAISPADRLARLCRHHGISLGLVAAGRWWTVVWAPRDAEATYVTFDTADWSSAGDRPAIRAFLSLLSRRRFFAVPDDETVTALLSNMEDGGEAFTESLGQQVQQAVELLVAAIGRADVEAREAGRPGLSKESAADVYKAALATQMRILFAFFAEEKGLLPADNPLYRQGYSAGGLCADLEERARDSSEEELEQSTAAWHRLVALFRAIYYGVDHPSGLRISGYDGSLFEPLAHPWLEGDNEHAPLPIDDRTVLHMLRAVQFVTMGVGRSRERRRTTFAALSIAQIGHVYEGLLEYEGQRAASPVIGLIGKPGRLQQIELVKVERLASDCVRTAGPSTAALATALSTEYKSSGIGTPKALERALRPPGGRELHEAKRKLLAATGGDAAHAARLLPWYGIIRHDLRGLPVVISPGGLYVGRSSKRRTTGAHYTPESLAAEVVQGALDPLVYSPGPLDTADAQAWVLKPSREILRLKVADIACGSGAFLVAACRYLAERLVEARASENEAEARNRLRQQFATDVIRPHEPFLERADVGPDLVMIRARREIAERCLYGVDINPLAVELAKFAIWLDTVEPGMPFTFLDDRLIDGDSLVGVSSPEQVEMMHLLPEHRTVHDRSPVDYTATVPQQTGLGTPAEHSARLRESIVGIPGTSLAALGHKREVLAQAEEHVQRLEFFGELLVTASLAYAEGGRQGLRRAAIAAASHLRLLGEAAPEDRADIEKQAREELGLWKRAGLSTDADNWKPINWPYRFPEVFRHGGFDAIVGNPPFLGGQKLTGTLGKPYREYVVHALGRGRRGSADLVAYFLLRAHELLNERGQTGLIATNTLAQGDTREVGLDQLVADGVTIRQSVKSAPWPSRSAVLEYCAVWTSRAAVAAGGLRVADGVPAKGITSSLGATSRVTGTAHRLAANQGIAFIGSYVLGLGFTMEPETSQALISQDERYREVLFPYLNGQDLNSRPDSSASRWVINFRDWSEERAKRYPKAHDQALRDVKPERLKVKFSKTARERWWQYERRRPELYGAIESLDQVLAIALVGKVVMPVMLPARQVFSHMLSVFATDDPAMLALLSSAPHYWWAIERASTLETRIRYTPSDVFETFPRPELTPSLRDAGDCLNNRRREILLARGGPTATYNLVHDAACRYADIAELRAVHRVIDEEVARAYGWHDLLTQPGGLDHGFHATRQGPRFTVGPVVRQEILDRLLELNQSRYAAEQSCSAAGVQDELPGAPDGPSARATATGLPKARASRR